MYKMCVCVCVCVCREIWERRPLFLSRHKPQYNEGWFSTDELDRILREVTYHYQHSSCIIVAV